MAEGRRDPGIQIGLVFLFFYGIERRLLLDGLEHRTEVQGEYPLLIVEIQRLMSIYGSSGSFQGYASRLLDYCSIFGTQEKKYLDPPPVQGSYKILTMHHKIALGQLAQDGVPLPPEWAYSWYLNDYQTFLRTPARRCPDEFKAIFIDLYKETYGPGMILPKNKTKIRVSYHQASPSLSSLPKDQDEQGIPDVTVLSAPINKLRSVAESATAKLDSYSRFIGRAPEKKGTAEAVLCLPSKFWPPQMIKTLEDWIAQLPTVDYFQLSTFGELLQRLQFGIRPSSDQIASLINSFEEIGYGLEPDIRWTKEALKESSKIALIPLAPGEKHFKASPTYRIAALTTQLAAAVAAADGVSAAEGESLQGKLETWAGLSMEERLRLQAYLKLLILNPTPLPALRKRVGGLSEEQRQAMAAFLIFVAKVEGGVSPSEIKTLSKIFRALGFEEKDLYQHIMEVATEPITVVPASTDTCGHPLPPKPKEEGKAGLTLNKARIAALAADTERISAILGQIFIDEAQPSSPPEDEDRAQQRSIGGLDASQMELLQILASRDSWERAELEDLAKDRGFMLDGALEQINEATFREFDQPLLDGNDPVEINVDLLKEFKVT